MSEPTVAIMVPMHGYPERTLKSVWAGWYHLNYPRDKIKFFFAIPANSPKRSYVMQNFKLNKQIISLDINFTKPTDNRFYELGKIRDLLLEYGKKFDYGWFLDSDVIPPPESIHYFLEDPVDIAGGVVLIPDNELKIRLGFGYFKPNYDFSRHLPADDLFPVHAVNTACMWLTKKVMNDKQLSFKIWNIKTPDNKPFALSEDHGYCFNALQRKYMISVDRRVKCKHLRNFGGKILNLHVPDYV